MITLYLWLLSIEMADLQFNPSNPAERPYQKSAFRKVMKENYNLLKRLTDR